MSAIPRDNDPLPRITVYNKEFVDRVLRERREKNARAKMQEAMERSDRLRERNRQIAEDIKRRNSDAHKQAVEAERAIAAKRSARVKEQIDILESGYTMAFIRDELTQILPDELTIMDVFGRRRDRVIAKWRHALFHALAKYTTQSLPCIGRFVDGRDHTTVVHSRSKVEAAIEAKTAKKITSPNGIVFYVP